MAERLFVAVEPPEHIVDGWDTFLEPRRAADPSLRWTDPQGWHLTCAFMAAVPLSLIDPLTEALSEVAHRTQPFGITVAGGGAFPDPDRAKVLWLGVTSGLEELAQFATRCRFAAGGCGVSVEGGKPRPHLTLARHRPINARRWLTILDAIEPAVWTVADFGLFRSRMLAGGSGYERLARFDLSADGGRSQPRPRE